MNRPLPDHLQPSPEIQGPGVWDAVVIGAGPAGSVAAHQLAKRGLSTLLVEAKRFPRPKTCGGCLNTRAIAALEAGGLGTALADCKPAPLNELEVFYRGRSLRLPTPTGLGVSRHTMDAAFVAAAEHAGVTFAPETKATVLPVNSSEHREVRLRCVGRDDRTVRCRAVLACDGLGHPSLVELTEIDAPQVASHSRVGLGVVLEASDSRDCCPSGRIQMAVGRAGYVGLARCEQGRLSLASAVDPKALAAAESPHALIQQILAESGIPSPHFSTPPRWLGTRPLTQCSPRVGAERLFLLGDAAGYVEPFTGEGMAAAIDGACRVSPFVQRAATEWRPEISAAWEAEYTRYVRSRQTTIRSLAWLLRHPRLLGLGFQTISSRPQLGAVVARWVGTARPSKKNHAL